MKATGIIRRIDDLGRIVIPRELRKRMFGSVSKAECAPIEFYYEDDGTIILKPYESISKGEDVEVGIKGMEMPCDCWSCDFTHENTGGLSLCSLTGKPLYPVGSKRGRASDCPLVDLSEEDS